MNKDLEVSNMVVEFNQPGDENRDNVQFIKVEMLDQGAGHYFVISTERWAFDEVQDLIDILNRVKSSLEDMKNDK